MVFVYGDLFHQAADKGFIEVCDAAWAAFKEIAELCDAAYLVSPEHAVRG